MSDDTILPPRVINFLEQKQKREVTVEQNPTPLGLSDEEIYVFLYVLDILRDKSAMQNGEIVFTPDSISFSLFHPLGEDKEIGSLVSTNVFAERVGVIDFEWETQEEFELIATEFKKLLEDVCS